MKYSCNVVKDLLPLYVDNICSKESKEIVEQHLSECVDCKAYYISLRENNTLFSFPVDTKRERQKAQSFLAIKKSLRTKQFLVAILSISVLIVAIIAAVALLSSYEKAVIYDDNISVSMVDGSLVERLRGSNHEQVFIKRVETQKDGGIRVYLFFCIYDTKWNELITDKNVYSECVLCPSDRGADSVDAVYYFTGNADGIESLSSEEVEEIIENSVLLWSK